MNKIDTSQIVDPSALQPFTGKSLEFLQNSTKDMVTAFANNLYRSDQRDKTKPIVVSDLYKSPFGYIVDGYMFGGLSNSEVYFVKGATVSGFSNTPLVTPDFGNDSIADPVNFSDGSLHNVHNIRKYKIVDSPFSVTTPPSYLYTDLLQKQGFTTLTASGNTSGILLLSNDLENGNVYMQGTLVITATLSGALTIPVLPIEYRPLFSKAISFTLKDGTIDYVAAVLTIDSGTGALSYLSPSLGSNSFTLYLDGINYRMAI